MVEPLSEWTESMNHKFIKKLESFPCLWNRNYKSFANPASKALALNKLSQHMNLPGYGPEHMRRKVLELKATFAREKRRMFEVLKDGGEFIPRFRWFGVANNYLGKVIRVRRVSFYKSDDDTSPVTSSIPSNMIDQMQCNDTDTVKMCLSKAVNAVRHVTALSNGNEFDAFGRLVAIQLKKMPQRLAYELQAEIQTTISNKKLQSLAERFTSIPCSQKKAAEQVNESNESNENNETNDEPEVWVHTGFGTFEACSASTFSDPIHKMK